MGNNTRQVNVCGSKHLVIIKLIADG